MRAPKTLYNLKYYARKQGYTFNKKIRVVTASAGRRSSRVESRLKSFGYAIQLNLFSDEN